jgi:hypothetical protein
VPHAFRHTPSVVLHIVPAGQPALHVAELEDTQAVPVSVFKQREPLAQSTSPLQGGPHV